MTRSFTEDDLRDGLRAIATWGEPLVVPPLPDESVVPLDPYKRRTVPHVWWAGAAVLLVVVLVASTFSSSSRAPVASGTWMLTTQPGWSSAPIQPRADAASVWTGTDVIVVGGQSLLGESLRDAAAYNPRTNEWRKLPDAPSYVQGGSDAVWDGHEVLVFPPSRSSAVTGVPEGADYGHSYPRAELQAFDPATRKWRILPYSFVQAPVVVDGRVLAMTFDDTVPFRGPQRAKVMQLDEHDTWREIAAIELGKFLPMGPQGWAGHAIDGRVVFLAREWHPQYMDATTVIGFVVDPVTGSVQALDPPPVIDSPLSRKDTSIVEGKVAATPEVLLFLARTNGADGVEQSHAAVFDVHTMTWRRARPPMASGQPDQVVRGKTLTAVGNDFILLGADPNGFDVDMGTRTFRKAYITAEDRWDALPEGEFDLERAGHTAVWTGSELVVWGGVRSSTRKGGVPNTLLWDAAVYRFDR